MTDQYACSMVHDNVQSKSKVLVLVVSMMRPYFLDECLKSIFQSMTPIKVRLVNQGDRSEGMTDVLKKWCSRYDVDYIFNEYPTSMAKIRSETFTLAKDQLYDFVVTIDDDMILMPGVVDKLIKIAISNPQYHAIAGYCIESNKIRMLGGKERIIKNCHHFINLPYTIGLTEVDFVSSGLRIVRLKPLILQDTDYDFGLIDWDYSKRIRKAGLRLAVTGEVGGYHRMIRKKGKWLKMPNPEAYTKIRLNRKRIEKMTRLFEKKWGVTMSRRKLPLYMRFVSRIRSGLGSILFTSVNLNKQLRASFCGMRVQFQNKRVSTTHAESH